MDASTRIDVVAKQFERGLQSAGCTESTIAQIVELIKQKRIDAIGFFASDQGFKVYELIIRIDWEEHNKHKNDSSFQAADIIGLQKSGEISEVKRNLNDLVRKSREKQLPLSYWVSFCGALKIIKPKEYLRLKKQLGFEERISNWMNDIGQDIVDTNDDLQEVKIRFRDIQEVPPQDRYRIEHKKVFLRMGKEVARQLSCSAGDYCVETKDYPINVSLTFQGEKKAAKYLGLTSLNEPACAELKQAIIASLIRKEEKRLSNELVDDDHSTGSGGNRKTGLNDPCPCGSGLKYKNCHGKPVADVSKPITNTDLSEKQNANTPRRQTITYIDKADNKRKARTKKTVSRIAFAFAALAICLGVVVLCKKVFFSNKAKPLSAVFFDSAKQGDTFILGKYEQDNQLENGPEDIEWVVVNAENGLVLAMSKHCLESMPYAEGEHIETDWEHCSLRQWLNDDFYNACFSDTEKRWICSTCLQNPDAFAFQTPGGYNTVDHVFLLSGPDLVNCYDGYDFKLLQYSWDKSVTDQKMTKIISASSNFPELKTTYTPYAKEMYYKQQRIAWGSLKTEEGIREDYADIENEYGNSAADWWLRSPGEWLDDTMLVSWSGTAYSNPSRSSSIGVRPAILLSATAMDSDPSGSGSVGKRPDVLTSETDPFSPKQWVADEQKVLVTLDDGSVIYIGYHMNDYDSVSSWKNIKKVAVGEGIVVGLTNDGSIVYSALDETAYDFASLTKLKDICDVCICNNAENPTNDKYHGLILCLSTDGTVYGTFAGGCNTYQDNCKGISASEDEFIILNTDGTISGNTYNHGSYPHVNDWTDISQVACGSNFIAGLKSDGTVVVDGNCVTPTLSGERVLKQDETYGAIDESFNVSDWKEIVAIAAGTHHLAGLKRDGTVVAIGLNYYGQCDTDDWSTIVSVEASHNLTIGHMADGSIVLAGKNIVDNVIDLQGKADANIYYSR